LVQVQVGPPNSIINLA